MSYESVLCVVKECMVYRIPPRSTARGYRASDWNVEQFLWKGRLRIIAVGDDCALHLEDAVTGELFARCPYDLEGTAMEPVLDSSRYFVVRIVDAATGSHAFVGLGFPERSWAFDVNVALQDHVKRVRQARQPAAATDAAVSAAAADWRLADGQMLTIALGGADGGGARRARGDGGDGGAAPLLPPPPRADDFGAFGDFVGATAMPQMPQPPPQQQQQAPPQPPQPPQQQPQAPAGWTTF